MRSERVVSWFNYGIALNGLLTSFGMPFTCFWCLSSAAQAFCHPRLIRKNLFTSYFVADIDCTNQFGTYMNHPNDLDDH